jgi:hypothetical protein
MKSIVLLMLVSVVTLAQAQLTSNSAYRKYTVGAAINANVYQGDLTPSRFGSFKTAKPGIFIFGTYAINQRLTAQLSGSWLALKGSDSKYNNPSYRRERNFLFTASIKEIEAKLKYSLQKYFNSDYNFISPYIATGVGIGFYNIKADGSGLSSKLANQQPEIAANLILDIANGTPKRLIYIPITVGAKQYLTPRIDVFAEWNYKLINSDYLDGFSLAANPNKKDKYQSFSVGAIYKFYKTKADKMGCPKW